MSQQKSKLKVGPLIIGLLVVSVSLLALWQKDYISDSLLLLQHPPSTKVSKLAQDVDMSDYGSRVFFASRPQIEEAESFNQHCGSHEPGAAILGCFINERIYLFNVSDPELSGITEVTAAHEMLHAAYRRLDSAERARIERLLIDQADSLEPEGSLKDRMVVYRKLSKADRLNEYHSIFATELTKLSPELESYYQRYFKDRKRVVALHQQYSGVFLKLQKEADKLSSWLERNSQQINQEVEQYHRDSSAYSSQVKSFNSRATSGTISEADFTYLRQQLISIRDDLNVRADQINQKIKTYHQKQDQLAVISSHIAKLNNSIDSNIKPLPQIGSSEAVL